MLNSEIIRDVAQALPWLASEPAPEPIPPGVSAAKRSALLNAYAKGLRDRYDSLYPVIDRAGQKLAAAFKELDLTENLDPDGEGTEALESAEAYFHAQRGELDQLRNALVRLWRTGKPRRVWGARPIGRVVRRDRREHAGDPLGGAHR